MAKLETYQCDCCGKLKGETNHWFTFYLKDLAQAKIDGFTAQLVIGPFVPERVVEMPEVKHLCGQECVLKMVAQGLEKL